MSSFRNPLATKRSGTFKSGNIRIGQAFNIQTGEPIDSSFLQGARTIDEVRARLSHESRRIKEGQDAAFTQATGADPNSPDVPRTFEQAVALSNKKNEERFALGLELFDQMQNNANQFGQFQREQLRRQDIQQEGVDVQSLISRGLLNSSGLEDLQRARQEDTRFQNLALDESLLRERNAIIGDRIGFIERRTDASPDPALFANLQTAASSAPSGSFLGSGVTTQRATGSSSTPRANTDFAGREVQQFGRLVFRNPGGSSGAINSNRSTQQNNAKQRFAERGVNLSGLSNSEIDSILRSVGIVISSVSQIDRLSPATLSNINAAIQRARGR